MNCEPSIQLKPNQIIAQEEGSVTWNFEIHSVPADLYNYSESSVRIFLEVFCVIMLAINSALETIGVVPACMCTTKKNYK
jgi:hypothetical protein